MTARIGPFMYVRGSGPDVNHWVARKVEKITTVLAEEGIFSVLFSWGDVDVESRPRYRIRFGYLHFENEEDVILAKFFLEREKIDLPGDEGLGVW